MSRWGHRLALASALCAFAASCGKIADGGDGGVSTDAGDAGSCNSDTDCQVGAKCLYPPNGGCSATRSCIASSSGQCKGAPACACDGTDTTVCGGAPKPVAHLGSCNEHNCPLACESCDVSGFAPATMAMPAKQIGACTPTEIAAFVAACMTSTATPTTCQAWQQSAVDAGACASCIFTTQSAAAWGPLVCTSSGCTFNLGGCTDLVLAETSYEQAAGGTGSCGDLVDASDGCITYACGSCTTTSDWTTCSGDATAAECKAYFDAASTSPLCESNALELPACSPSNDAQYTQFVSIFCGTGP